MRTFLVCLFLAGSNIAFSQADSLLNVLKTSDGELKVKVMNELFRSYVNSDPVTAIGYAREALTLAIAIKDRKGEAAANNNLGVAYRNQGALDIALQYYMKSLDIYQSIENGEGVATTKNNIANIYSVKKDFGQALKYYEESSNAFIALGQDDKIIGLMNNLGNLHSELQLYDKSLNYYNEAWKLSEKSGTPTADPLTNIGNMFYRQENYQRAVEYYLRALSIVKSQNNRISELGLLANLGETYAMAGQPAEAQKYLDDALALATELQASLYIPQILRSEAKNYERQGKMREAYSALVQFEIAKEKIYGEESTRKISQMNMALQLREKEREIEALQIDDRMKTLKLRNIQFIVTAGVLAIVSLVAVANLAFVRKRLRSVK